MVRLRRCLSPISPVGNHSSPPDLSCTARSHTSAGGGLAAVAPGRVGVDLERVEPGSIYPIEALATRSDLAALDFLALHPHALGAVAWAVQRSSPQGDGTGPGLLPERC